MTWIDTLIIVLVLLSCVAGFMRGLLREAIGLISWVAALWLAWIYGTGLEPSLGGTLAHEALRPWAARIVIFIAVLLVGSVIGAVVAHFVRLSIFSGTDRMLGGLFGALRSFIVIGVLVILCHGLKLQGESWYRNSLLVPYGEQVANVLRGLVGERKIQSEHSVAALK